MQNIVDYLTDYLSIFTRESYVGGDLGETVKGFIERGEFKSVLEYYYQNENKTLLELKLKDDKKEEFKKDQVELVTKMLEKVDSYKKLGISEKSKISQLGGSKEGYWPILAVAATLVDGSSAPVVAPPAAPASTASTASAAPASAAPASAASAAATLPVAKPPAASAAATLPVAKPPAASAAATLPVAKPPAAAAAAAAATLPVAKPPAAAAAAAAAPASAPSAPPQLAAAPAAPSVAALAPSGNAFITKMQQKLSGVDTPFTIDDILSYSEMSPEISQFFRKYIQNEDLRNDIVNELNGMTIDNTTKDDLRNDIVNELNGMTFK
jgi:hypothetical protein